MNCDICKGACCEGFKLVFDLAGVQSPDPDFQRFQSYRIATGPIAVHLDIVCTKLKDGRCSIYEDRPNVCQNFEKDSLACKHVVMMRRTEKEAIAIGEFHELL